MAHGGFRANQWHLSRSTLWVQPSRALLQLRGFFSATASASMLGRRTPPCTRSHGMLITTSQAIYLYPRNIRPSHHHSVTLVGAFFLANMLQPCMLTDWRGGTDRPEKKCHDCDVSRDRGIKIIESISGPTSWPQSLEFVDRGNDLFTAVAPDCMNRCSADIACRKYRTTRNSCCSLSKCVK